MRAVLWLTAAFAIFYGGYWAVGSRAVMDGTETALAELRAAGLANYGAVTLEGFPSRFDLTVTAPELTNLNRSVDWSASELRVYALSYRPHHIITVLPKDQTLRLGRETIRVQTDDLRASVVFGIDPALPLDHAQSVGKEMVLSSDHGWGSTLREARLALRQGASAAEQELGAEVFDLAFSGLPAEFLQRSGLPVDGGYLRLDAVLGLDRPLDRFAPAGGLKITEADIRSFEADWGPIRMTGSGRIEITPSGQPEGRISLTITGWKRALPLAIELGLIRPELAPTVENALGELAKSGGDGSDLSLPLVFTGGWMSLGPVPLGPAPHF
jgi:hypothetical protein